MDNIIKHIHFLELLANPASEEQAKALVSAASNKQINVISELALNLLQERLEISRHYINLLKKDAETIRDLADRGYSQKKRKNIAKSNIKTVSELIRICLKLIR